MFRGRCWWYEGYERRESSIAWFVKNRLPELQPHLNYEETERIRRDLVRESIEAEERGSWDDVGQSYTARGWGQ